MRPEIIGEKTKVKVLSGKRTYIFFDNAASTPALRRVKEKLDQVLPYYSNVERGIGYKSFVSTELFEEAREKVREFLDVPESHTVIFTKNTTEAINKLARRMKEYIGNGKVLTTEMEHHSNLLPWLKYYDTVVVPVDSHGRLDLNRIEDTLKKESGKIKLVSVSGASNVTGFPNPIYEIGEIAHRYGALFSVDGAQLVPHKRVYVSRGIDFLSFSAHKFYAPFGSGALVARSEFFSDGVPESVGGGTVKFVSLDEVIWADLPEREEAGTPVILGAVALAEAMRAFEEWGMENLERREEELHRELYRVLSSFDRIEILGGERRPGDFPVISFTVKGASPYLISSVLSFEYAIGVRTGCFCAQPYVKKLMGVSREETERVKENLIEGKLPGLGAIRTSLSFYNTVEEIEVLKQALEEALSRREFHYKYEPHLKAFVPENFKFSLPF